MTKKKAYAIWLSTIRREGANIAHFAEVDGSLSVADLDVLLPADAEQWVLCFGLPRLVREKRIRVV